MPTNCFQHLTEVNPKFKAIPTNKVYDDPLQYFLKVSVDNYIDLEIGRIQEKLWHVSNLVMRGIYDVLPPNTDFIEYPISLKKVPKEEGAWDLIKEVLGFEFGGNPQYHTIWMTKYQREKLLQKFKEWIQGCIDSSTGIPFNKF